MTKTNLSCSLVLALGALFSAVTHAGTRLNIALEKVQATHRPLSSSVVLHSEKSLMRCPLHHVSLRGPDPIDSTERKVAIKMYLPRGTTLDSAKSAATVVLLPPTGGETNLDRMYANTLCSAGLRVALLSEWEGQLETSLDPSMHDKGALRSLAAIRHLLDYLEPKSPEQIGILGTSIGAFSASLALGYDSRLSTGVSIAGAGDLADTIAHSDQSGAVELRESRMRAFHLESQEQYQNLLREKITIEPIEFAGHTGPKKVMTVIVDGDLTVPTSYQERLARALQAVEVIRLEGQRVASIVKTALFHRTEIRDFFLRHLRSEP